MNSIKKEIAAFEEYIATIFVPSSVLLGLSLIIRGLDYQQNINALLIGIMVGRFYHLFDGASIHSLDLLIFFIIKSKK